MRMQAEDVDVEDALRLDDRVFLGSARRADAGVVDQHVEPPEPLDHLLDHGGHRLIAGHVEVEVGHPAARGDPGRVPARSDHLEARVGQCQSGRLPDS